MYDTIKRGELFGKARYSCLVSKIGMKKTWLCRAAMPKYCPPLRFQMLGNMCAESYASSCNEYRLHFAISFVRTHTLL
jgi:hypothetical protein